MVRDNPRVPPPPPIDYGEISGDGSGTALPPIEPTSLRVAYHAGPPDLWFGGLLWTRGVPQQVTQDRWNAMQARGDFAPFDFRSE